MINKDCRATPRPPQDIEDKGSSAVTLLQHRKLDSTSMLRPKDAWEADSAVLCGQNCPISLLLSQKMYL